MPLHDRSNYLWSDAPLDGESPLPEHVQRLSTEPPERFPPWALGREAWRTFLERLTEEGLEELRDALRAANHRTPPRCPRLFVSHRQPDVPEALRIAYLATQEGFHYWVDVLNPSLRILRTWRPSLTRRQHTLLLAGIIEMGLGNSTHVCVTYTQNTKGSAWVPYEYGRVADPLMRIHGAGAWVGLKVAKRSLPEYMHLGRLERREHGVRTWLAGEYSAHGGTCPKPSLPAWAFRVPKPLP